MMRPKKTGFVIQAGFSSILLLGIIYVIYTLHQLRHITLDISDKIALNNQKTIHTEHMHDVIRQRQLLLYKIIATKDVFKRDELKLEFYKIAQDFVEERNKLLKLPLTTREQKLLDSLLKEISETEPLSARAVDILLEDRLSNDGMKFIENVQTRQKKIYQLMDNFIHLQNKSIQDFTRESKKEYEITQFFTVILGLIVILLAIFIARISTRFVSQKNAELIEKNEKLSEVSDEAVRATKTKSEFLATMSHEIRTPLTAIIGFAEALSDRKTRIEERISLNKKIIKNGKHLLEVINDILDISKIEAQKMELEAVDFSPVTLVQDVEQVMKDQFVEKGIQFHIEYDYPVPLTIKNDPLRTKQVLLNLCSNALKFTESGKVTIRLCCDAEKEIIFFTVNDSGIGLTEEQKETIFEAYTQAGSSTTKKYGGTGLGLTLSQQFAKKMGGKISVESLIDVGSQFTFQINTGKIDGKCLITGEPELPVRKEEMIYGNYDHYQVEGKVLVVEDNTDNQDLISILLGDTGASLDFADNGKQAVEILSKEDFDLVLMDMQMLVMGGIEAATKLRMYGYKKPIVALTANAMQSDQDACIEAGCNEFLTKPVNKNELLRVIYTYLEFKQRNEDNQSKIISDIYSAQSVRMRELIIRFVKELPGRMNSIEKYYQEKEWEKLSEELHKLKGMGTSMGYPMITDISAGLGYEVARKNYVEINKLLKNLKNTCQRIEKSLPELIENNKLSIVDSK